MKNIYRKKDNLIIIGMLLFCISANANWLKAENKNSLVQQEINSQQNIVYTQSAPYTQDTNTDSLPVGVTKDWLNKIRDKNGNKIFPEHRAPPGDETDAMQQTVFDAHVAGEDFGKCVSSAGDVNGDGYDDIIIGASANNNYTGKEYIYFGGVNMNTIADVTLKGELTY
jgi:FG-GAP repeat